MIGRYPGTSRATNKGYIQTNRRGPRAVVELKSAMTCISITIHPILTTCISTKSSYFPLFTCVEGKNRYFTILGRVWQSHSNFYITGLIFFNISLFTARFSIDPKKASVIEMD
jgi:hypothetical protein